VGFIVRHVPRVGKNCPKNHQEILINPEDFVKGETYPIQNEPQMRIGFQYKTSPKARFAKNRLRAMLVIYDHHYE